MTTDKFDRIDKLISKKKKDTFLNHFITIFLIRENFIGEKTKNKYIIWKYSYNWTGIFYPVVIIEQFDTESQKIKITTHMNSFGKVFCFLFFIFLVFGLYKSGLLFFSFNELFFSFCVLLLIALFNIPIYLGYRFSKRMVIEEINEILDNSNVR